VNAGSFTGGFVVVTRLAVVTVGFFVVGGAAVVLVVLVVVGATVVVTAAVVPEADESVTAWFDGPGSFAAQPVTASKTAATTTTVNDRARRSPMDVRIPFLVRSLDNSNELNLTAAPDHRTSATALTSTLFVLARAEGAPPSLVPYSGMRRTGWRGTVVVGTALFMVVAACSGDPAAVGPPSTGGGTPNGSTASGTQVMSVATTRLPLRPAGAAVRLVGFESCDALLADLKAQGTASLGPSGLNSKPSAGGAQSSSSDTLPTTDGRPEVSLTNTQEKEVDEPDAVKTDGVRIFVLSTRLLGSTEQPTIVTLDVTGADPKHTSTVELPPEVRPESLLLAGDRLLVFGASGNAPPPPGEERDPNRPSGVLPSRYATTTTPGTPPAPVQTGRNAAEALLYDVSGRDPRLISQLSVAGHNVSARMIQGRVYLAISGNSINERFVTSRAQRSAAGAQELNQRLLDSSIIDDWIPLARVSDAGAAPVVQRVVPCHRITRPDNTRSFNVLSLLAFDLAGTTSLGTADATGLLTSSNLMYASPSTLVLKSAWSDAVVSATDPDRDADSLHVFGLAPGNPPAYQGSALIDGSVSDPFQISEWQGALRVASRKGSYVNGQYVSSTSLVTFTLDADGPHPAGRIDMIGTDETLTAVRFVGPLGYLATARNVDPLHVVDLRDPAHPAITGELKIPGTSQYLHPIDDTLLLGIGSIWEPSSDTGASGRNRFDAVLFDVTDPTKPTEIQRTTLDNVASESQWDHHAFVWWPKTQTALFPLSRSTYNLQPLTAMAKLEARREGMTMTATPPIAGWSYDTRAVIIGDTLHMLVRTGVITANLDTMAVTSRIAFG